MNNKEYGHIKLYRSLLKDPDWYNGKSFDKGKAWVDLLLRANHEDKNVDIGKGYVHVKAGQVLTSQRGLTKKWKLSRNTIKKWLNDWEKVSHKLSHKTNRDIGHGNTIITINNWIEYQGERGKSEPLIEHKQEYKKENTSTSFKGKSQGSDPVFLSDLTPEQRKEVIYVKWD